jgi:hypothetical protein
VRARECPFCCKDKFYVNASTGLYDCKHCGEQGNPTTYLTRLHRDVLKETTPAYYSKLGKLRGIAPQTLRLHELAFCAAADCWVVPFKNAKGNVVNLLQYFPDQPKPNKFLLPKLPSALFGYERLVTADKDKPVILCEGHLPRTPPGREKETTQEGDDEAKQWRSHRGLPWLRATDRAIHADRAA